MREQSSAIVLAVGKDGLVRGVDIAVVLGLICRREGQSGMRKQKRGRSQVGEPVWPKRGREPWGQEEGAPPGCPVGQTQGTEPPHGDPSAFGSLARPSLLF